MRKYFDWILFALLILIIYPLLKYQEVRDQTTITFIMRPLLYYYFLIFPLLGVEIGYWFIRGVLYKAKVSLLPAIRKITIGLIAVVWVLFLVCALIGIIGLYVQFMNSSAYTDLIGILMMIYQKYFFVFVLTGAVFSLGICACKE